MARALHHQLGYGEASTTGRGPDGDTRQRGWTSLVRWRLAAPLVMLVGVLLLGSFSSADAVLISPIDAIVPPGLLPDPLCPATSQIGSSTGGVPVIGPVTGTLSSAVCNVALIEFTFRTTVNDRNGRTIVHDRRTLLNIPTPLAVGNDLLPRLIGTVTAVSASQVTVSVNKALGAPSALPVQVELIARDPRNVNSDSRISVGYDGRALTAPTRFRATLGILSTGAPAHLTVAVDQTGGGNGTALLAGLTGTANGVAHATSARFGMTPMPATVSADVTLGQDDQDVKLTTSEVTRVAAQVSLVDGSREQRIEGTIDRLPTSVEVHVSSAQAGQRRLDYTANRRIATLQVTYKSLTHDLLATHLDQQADVDVAGVPTGLSVTQNGPRAASLTTSGGSIDRIEAGFATNGAPVSVAGTDSGGHVVVQAPLTSVALRLRGVTAAVIDATGPYVADLRSRTQPLRVVVEDRDANRSIDAEVRDLPAHLRLNIDPDAGVITSDSDGEDIDRISVKATAAQPFFARATRIEGTILGVPAEMTLRFRPTSGNVVEVSTDQPIGEIDLLASDGRDQTLPGTHPGVVYTDTPDAYAVTAKVSALKRVAVGASPISGTVETGSPQVFGINLNRQETGGAPIRFDATIDQLPPSVSFALGDDGAGGQRLTYTASAPIRSIEVMGSGVPLPARAQVLYARVTDLPSGLTFTLPASGGFRFATADNQPVGRIQFQAASRVDDFQGFRTGPGSSVLDPFSRDADGVTLRQEPSTGIYALAAQVSGLRSAAFASDPLQVAVDVDRALARPFGLSIRTMDDAYYEGYVSRLAPHMTFQVPNTPGNGQRLVYSADASIPSFDIRSNFGDRGRYFQASVEQLPRRLFICVDAESEFKAACTRPRAAGAPDPLNPAHEGENTMMSFDIDDGGTAALDRIVPIYDGLFCLDEGDQSRCERGESQRTLRIDRLYVRNLGVDFNATRCGGFLFCGHIGIDTRDETVNGHIDYLDQHAFDFEALRYSLRADVTLVGLSASRRLTTWYNHPLTPPYTADRAWGRVRCGDNTHIKALAKDQNGAVVFGLLGDGDIRGSLC